MLFGHLKRLGKRKLFIRNFSKAFENYYDLLKVSSKASQEEIKSAYYKISKDYHPDLNTGQEAKSKFLKINEAYKTLSNIRYRSDYDRELFGSHHTNFDEDYKEFLRRKDVFRKRSGGVRTGKTSHFDYDEFNRMHYQEAIKQNMRERQTQKEWDMNRKRDKQEAQTTLSLYFIFLFTLISALLFQHH